MKMDLLNVVNGVYIVMCNNVCMLFEIKVIFCVVVILLILLEIFMFFIL